MLSNEYLPYLLEQPLPEDALNDPSFLRDIVIEMEPYTVVSGMIETHRPEREETMEQIEMEDGRSPIVRPEEVLIFFETDSGPRGKVNAVIPFAPASPTTTTIESSAEYIKE